MLRFTSLIILAATTAVVTASPFLEPIKPSSTDHDFSCKSSTHPHPIIAIHGILTNSKISWTALDSWLRPQGYCTFSRTYGAYPFIPIGGVKSVDGSSYEIADFIQEVLDRTGAKQVDLVAHSEGALLALYTPKFRGLATRVRKIIAIAPPTHGTTLSGVTILEEKLGISGASKIFADIVGLPAFNDLGPDADLVKKLNTGPIVQPGNEVTVIASRNDEIITPAGVASWVNELGVHNMFVQDYCPDDRPGHAALLFDTNVWELVRNSLENRVGRKINCTSTPSLPVRRDREANIAI